jgi:beta-lactamase regulating signal transducer with metallopeptidase domain/HEAT repeat protein
MTPVFAEGSSSPLWTAAGWTMLHYLWIGGLVGLLAAVLRRMTVTWGAEARYRLALVLLVLLATAPVGLFAWCAGQVEHDAVRAKAHGEIEFHRPRPSDESTDVMAANEKGDVEAARETRALASESPTATADEEIRGQPPASETTDPATREAASASLVAWLPWLWLLGTPATLLLLATGCLGAARLRRMARPLDDDTSEACRRLAESLDVALPVVVAACDRVAAPILVGILRPMILLPPSALAGWTPQELEMVLLHELAHVRRWDNLVNFAQRLIESLLFYQPAVWLVSDWVRREREHACDELVAARTGGPRDYARLLARLAAAQAGASHLFDGLVSSSMARSHLASRIRYLIYREYEPMRTSAKLWTMAGVVLLVLLGVVGWQQFSTRAVAEAGDEPQGAASADAANEENAEEKETQNVSPPIAKELLRYDGKTFAQWSTEWRTELKPIRRQEAIEAFRAFAVNGFGPEAAETIVEVMRNYDASTLRNSPEGRLKSAALSAIGEIPKQDALPALTGELRRGTTWGKVFVLTALNRHDGPREALPAVLSLLDDKSPLVRSLAVRAVGELATRPEEVSAVLLKSMRDGDAKVREAAVETADGLKLKSAPFMAAYRAALKDESAGVAAAALHALAPRRSSAVFGGMAEAGFDEGGAFGLEDAGGYEEADFGGSPRVSGIYVPEMLDALQHPDDRLWRRTADTLGGLGEKARPAVPPLVKLACEGEVHLQQRASYALGRLTRRDSDVLDKLIADEIAKAIKTGEGERRLAALRLLANFQERLGAAGTRTIPAVSQLVDDQDEQIREAAKRILERYGR